MFAALDDGKIIAIHDKKHVVIKYISMIYKYHNIKLDLVKLKKQDIKIENYDNLYLVRYGDSYVQSGYCSYLELIDNGGLNDYRYASDILYRILEIENLSPKEEKMTKKVIMMIENLIYNKDDYTPSLKELRNLKENYEEYFYNSGIDF